MKKLNELFVVTYGNKLDMNKMVTLPRSQGGAHCITVDLTFREMLPHE